MARNEKFDKVVDLIGLFDALYVNKYGKPYVGNTYSDKWSFIDMMDDLGYKGAERVIRFYFKTNPRGGHSRQHLAYHYHEYHQEIENLEADKRHKRRILENMRREYEGRD